MAGRAKQSKKLIPNQVPIIYPQPEEPTEDQIHEVEEEYIASSNDEAEIEMETIPKQPEKRSRVKQEMTEDETNHLTAFQDYLSEEHTNDFYINGILNLISIVIQNGPKSLGIKLLTAIGQCIEKKAIATNGEKKERRKNAETHYTILQMQPLFTALFDIQEIATIPVKTRDGMKTISDMKTDLNGQTGISKRAALQVIWAIFAKYLKVNTNEKGIQCYGRDENNNPVANWSDTTLLKKLPKELQQFLKSYTDSKSIGLKSGQNIVSKCCVTTDVIGKV